MVAPLNQTFLDLYQIIIVDTTGESAIGVSLFIFCSIAIIAYIGAKYRFSNSTLLIVLALFAVIIARTVSNSLLVVVLVVLGALLGFAIQRIVGSK
jgi:hypothetical protein